MIMITTESLFKIGDLVERTNALSPAAAIVVGVSFDIIVNYQYEVFFLHNKTHPSLEFETVTRTKFYMKAFRRIAPAN